MIIEKQFMQREMNLRCLSMLNRNVNDTWSVGKKHVCFLRSPKMLWRRIIDMRAVTELITDDDCRADNILIDHKDSL